MCGAERVIEIASYALIAAFGARLVWTKGGGFIRALQAQQPAPRDGELARSHDVTATIMHHHGHAHAHDHPSRPRPCP